MTLGSSVPIANKTQRSYYEDHVANTGYSLFSLEIVHNTHTLSGLKCDSRWIIISAFRMGKSENIVIKATQR
jgi:hypothetical protein